MLHIKHATPIYHVIVIYCYQLNKWFYFSCWLFVYEKKICRIFNNKRSFKRSRASRLYYNGQHVCFEYRRSHIRNPFEIYPTKKQKNKKTTEKTIDITEHHQANTARLLHIDLSEHFNFWKCYGLFQILVSESHR